mgnify:FL=1
MDHIFETHFQQNPVLPEDHTQDQFIDKLEELCGCSKGEGYIKALENIVVMNVVNKTVSKNIHQALGGRGNVDDPYGSIKELVAENEELKKDRVVVEEMASYFGKDEDDFDWEDEIGALVVENRELKKENEKLNSFINELKVNVVKKDEVNVDKKHSWVRLSDGTEVKVIH